MGRVRFIGNDEIPQTKPLLGGERAGPQALLRAGTPLDEVSRPS